MQSLEVISVNIWNILISLCNLVLLYVVLKKFLYKPVKKMMAQRQTELDEKYSRAQEAESAAESKKEEWDKKMQTSREEADEIIQKAVANANKSGERIVADAKDKADGIIRQAQTEAELERKKANDEMKREIVDISTMLTEKMLDREINEEDHRKLIDTFVENLGEQDDSDK